MYRIRFITRQKRELTAIDLANIEVIYQHKFHHQSITGALVTIGNTFYHVLEGEKPNVKAAFRDVERDDRFGNLLVLNEENGIENRSFIRWNMHFVDMDEDEQNVMALIQEMLQSLSTKNEKLTDAFETIRHYTPATVSRMVDQGVLPYQQQFRNTEKIIWFSDLVNFSAFTNSVSLDHSMMVLDTYIDININVVEKYGGDVDKIMGDGIMAHFEVSNADNALKAAEEMLEQLRQLRLAVADFSDIYAGIGLSAGQVVEGNLGNSSRMDYTILGEAVNRASKLESMTRRAGSALLLSETAADHLTDRGRLVEVELDEEPEANPFRKYMGKERLFTTGKTAVTDFPFPGHEELEADEHPFLKNH